MVYNESSAMTLGRMPDYMGVIKIPADFKHIWSNPRDPCKSIGDEAFKLLVQPKTNFGLPEKLSNRFRMIRMGFRFKLKANGQKHFVKSTHFGLLKSIQDDSHGFSVQAKGKWPKTPRKKHKVRVTQIDLR